MQENVMKVSKEKDTESELYHKIVDKICLLVGLESKIEAGNYLKCIYRYFL
jgi:hypothetical protein